MIKYFLEEVKFEIKEFFHFHLMKIEKPLEAQFFKCLHLIVTDYDNNHKTLILNSTQQNRRLKKLIQYLKKNSHLVLNYCNLNSKQNCSLLEYAIYSKNEELILTLVNMIAQKSEMSQQEFFTKKTEDSYLAMVIYHCLSDTDTSENILKKLIDIGARLKEKELDGLLIYLDSNHSFSKSIQLYKTHLIECEKQYLEGAIEQTSITHKAKMKI